MLLNKINCLDKGYVALLDSMNSTSNMEAIQTLFPARSFSEDERESLGKITLIIKCPIFVERYLFRYLDIVVAQPTPKEAFIPDETDIRSGSNEMDIAIADDIKRTTEALLINPTAYQQDGCDRFTSQLLTPISTYTTIIATATTKDLKELMTQKGLPRYIKVYQEAISDIAKAEWKHLEKING